MEGSPVAEASICVPQLVSWILGNRKSPQEPPPPHGTLSDPPLLPGILLHYKRNYNQWAFSWPYGGKDAVLVVFVKLTQT